MSDAIRSATNAGGTGAKPTPKQAWSAARKAVTGDNPKRRGTIRRAAAGLTAAGIAAGKVAWDARQSRKRRDAARKRLQERRDKRLAEAMARSKAAAARDGVNTTVRRATTATVPANGGSQRKPAPQPVRRPETAPNPTPTTPNKGLIIMKHPLLAVSEDFLAAARRNVPEGMLQQTAEAHMLPEILGNVHQSMLALYARAQDQPLHPSIKDMYEAVRKAQWAVVEATEEIGPAIERIHEKELDRLRNPRVGEEMWDTARNRGAA